MVNLDNIHNVLRPRLRAELSDASMSEDEMELRRTPSREPGLPSTTEPSARLAEQARVTLLRAVQLPQHAESTDLEVHALMCDLCEAAQASGLRAEQLLVVLKEAWRDLPAAHRPPYDEERAIFAHLVTLCIQAYYS